MPVIFYNNGPNGNKMSVPFVHILWSSFQHHNHLPTGIKSTTRTNNTKLFARGCEMWGWHFNRHHRLLCSQIECAYLHGNYTPQYKNKSKTRAILATSLHQDQKGRLKIPWYRSIPRRVSFPEKRSNAHPMLRLIVDRECGVTESPKDIGTNNRPFLLGTRHIK